MNEEGVFVFAEDGVQFFPTSVEAAAYVEAVDLENGVYQAFITLNGERLVPRPVDATSVRLEHSGEHDLANLTALLERERASGHAFVSDPRDPVAVAKEMLATDWDARWPKWPRWLDRRLHGAPPRHVEQI